MTLRCPSCKTSFEPKADQAARATATCPACGRVVVRGPAGGPSAGEGTTPEEPGTAPFLEPLDRAEEPTRVGAASQTLSLPAGKRVSVAILSGTRKGDAITLDRPSLTFGRKEPGSEADVQVDDPDVSRRHAALECYGGRIVLRDLGSRKGTFLADAPVRRREIEPGAEFRLGETTFLLVVTDA